MRDQIGDDDDGAWATRAVLQYQAEAVADAAGCGGFPLSDLGNAQRIQKRFGHILRYCIDRGSWYLYDGKHWSDKHGDAVIRCGMDMSLFIDREVLAEPDTQRRAELRKHAEHSQSRTAIVAALDLCRSLTGIATPLSVFDTDPMLFNCQNGTINLRTGQLLPHSPNDLITKVSPVIYDPDATHLMWDRFLAESMQHDAEKLEFLQRCAGYTLTGSTKEERFFMIYGPAASGKSTFLEAVKAVMADYSRTCDFETFLKGKGHSGPRNGIARLVGARFVVSIEVDDGAEMASGLTKQITGGDTVTGSELYKAEFEYRPQFKLWLACNDRPRVKDSDTGMWRRICVIGFDHPVPAERRDPTLKATLIDPTKAGSAILAWMVQGALKWQRDGLRIPQGVTAATQAYQLEQDPLRLFLEDGCHFGTDAGHYIPVTDLRRAYEDYCRSNGQRYPIGQREFNKRLETRGCEQKGKWIAGRNIKCWFGIRLISEFDSPQENPNHLTTSKGLSNNKRLI